MARNSLMLALSLGLLAFAGCGGGGHGGHQSDTTSHYSIVVEPAEPDWDAPLPPDVCFVASRNYEVEITARSHRRHGLCDRVATAYLPHEPRLRWPPPHCATPTARRQSYACSLMARIGSRSTTAPRIPAASTRNRSATRSSIGDGNGVRVWEVLDG